MGGVYLTETEFRKRVGSNISYYRKANGLTQSALAEKLNYSDKAVSKWERGESIPDTYVLYSISKIFFCSMNDIVGEQPEKNTDSPLIKEKIKQKKFKRGMITALSVGLNWLVVSLVFFIANMISNSILHQNNDNLWIIFLYGIPITFILTLIFSCLWGRIWQQGVSVSGILWGAVMSVLFTFKAFNFAEDSGKYLIIAAVVFQIIIILWFILKKKMNNSKQI